MNIIYANDRGVLEIGYAGEMDRTEVRFFYGDLEEEFPGGTVLLQVRRPNEDTKYNLLLPATDGEEHTASWIVSEYDCGIRGIGECQLVYTAGETVAKRKIWRTHVERSIEGLDASIPPDWEDIETRLLNAASAVRGAIDSAQQTIQQDLSASSEYAGRSETAASNAERDAGTATDAAASAQNAASVAESSANAAQNDAGNADAAAGRAETAANTAESAATNANAYRNEANQASSDAQVYASRATSAMTSAEDSANDALQAADMATEAAEDAATDALRAEGYAVGTQNGSPVSQGSTYFENNSKHYAELAQATMSEIANELALYAGLPFVNGVMDGSYWGGVLHKADALNDGATIIYKTPSDNAAGATPRIVLTLDDGSKIPARMVTFRGDGQYYSGSIIILTYSAGLQRWICQDKDYNTHLTYYVTQVSNYVLRVTSENKFYPGVAGYSLLRIPENITFRSSGPGLMNVLGIMFEGATRQWLLYVDGKSTCGYGEGDISGDPVVLPRGDYLFYYDGNQKVYLMTDGHIPGAKGEKGDTGNSGVYVGEEEPTDPEVNVWIDPDEGGSLIHVGDDEPADPYVGLWVDTNGEEGGVDPSPVYACYASHTGDTNHWNVTIPGVPYINGMTLIVRFQNLQYTGGEQACMAVNGRLFEWGETIYPYGPQVYKADHTAFTDAVPFNSVVTMTLFGNEWVVH